MPSCSPKATKQRRRAQSQTGPRSHRHTALHRAVLLLCVALSLTRTPHPYRVLRVTGGCVHRATAALVRGREEAARQFEARSAAFDDAELQGLNGGQIFAELMRQHGVKHVFGYPGGAILPVFDGMHQSPHFNVILPRHEQGAGHMAEGYARATGKPGVVVVTSGPGATNTITPMQDAMSDGIPLVVFTGQVPTTAIGSDAFQEADVLGISRFCTKWSAPRRSNPIHTRR